LSSLTDGSGTGIFVSNVSYGIIQNNTINDKGDSIRFNVVNWLEIINNTITNNALDGIDLEFTSGIIVTDNNIYGNAGYGLKLGMHTLYSEIYGNMIGFNNAGNAIDSGMFNDWDDGSGLGNIWSDYSGSGTYSVGVGTDRHPLGFLSRPDDVQYVIDSSIQPVIWDVRLPEPDSYTLFWEGTNITHGLLNSSLEQVSKSVDGLPIGSYNVTIIVNDQTGHSLIDTVIITVVEETVTTTTTTDTTTMTSSTPTETTTGTLPPPEFPMIYIVLGSVLIGVIGLIILVASRRK
jgi:parallel beta-helix repeat protein